MSAREVVLARLRAALGTAGEAVEVGRAYRRGGELDATATVELFAERVDDYRATVRRADVGTLAAVIAGVVRDAGHRRVAVPSGLDAAWLAGLPREVEVRRDHHDQPAAELDAVDVVITGAAVGIAETGTIVLDAGPDQGRRALTLVPDHHLCVVPAELIVQTVPEGLARLDPTRPLTMISGPSATSDIELDRVEGVHGPRVLDVVLLEAR